MSLTVNRMLLMSIIMMTRNHIMIQSHISTILNTDFPSHHNLFIWENVSLVLKVDLLAFYSLQYVICMDIKGTMYYIAECRHGLENKFLIRGALETGAPSEGDLVPNLFNALP